MSVVHGVASDNKVYPLRVSNGGILGVLPEIPASGGNMFHVFAGVFRKSYTNLNLSSGSSIHSIFTVPAGQVYVVETIAVMVVSSTVSKIQVALVSGSVTAVLFEVNGPSSSVYYTNFAQFHIDEGEEVRVAVVNATSGDDLHVRIGGYYFRK